MVQLVGEKAVQKKYATEARMNNNNVNEEVEDTTFGIAGKKKTILG